MTAPRHQAESAAGSAMLSAMPGSWRRKSSCMVKQLTPFAPDEACAAMVNFLLRRTRRGCEAPASEALPGAASLRLCEVVQRLAEERDAAADRRRRDTAEAEDEAVDRGLLDRESGDRRDDDAACRRRARRRQLREVAAEMADRVEAALGRDNLEEAAELAARGLAERHVTLLVDAPHAADMRREMALLDELGDDGLKARRNAWNEGGGDLG